MILFVFAIFTLLSVIVGVFAAKGNNSDSESYYLSNRNLKSFALGISASATANSGFIVVAAVGMGYSMGLGSILFPLAWVLGDLVFWFFFAEKINISSNKLQAIAITDLLDYKDSKYLRLLLSLIIISMLTIYASAQFDAAGKTLNSFFDMDEINGMLITLVILISYVFFGGFKSSIWTDFVQGIAMILLTASVLVWCYIEIGGFETILFKLNQVDPNFLNLFSGYESTANILAFVLGFAFTGFGFSISQPQVTSRIMAGLNPQEIRKSRWIYIGILHFTWIGMSLIGMMSRVLLPSIQDSEKALPLLATEYFHPMAIGLVLAGMFSAILSSLDSLVIASATSLSVDVLKNSSSSKAINFNRISTLSIAIMAIILTIFLSSSVFTIIIFAATILASTVGACVFIKILNLRASSSSLLVSTIIGLIVTLAWKYFEFNANIGSALIGFCSTVVINSILSLFHFFNKTME